MFERTRFNEDYLAILPGTLISKKLAAIVADDEPERT